MSFIQSHILTWIDVLWIPLAFFTVHKDQRLLALGFVLCCMFSLRLQGELLEAFDLAGGITGWIDLPSFFRGVIVYSLVVGAYLLLSVASPYTRGIIYLTASLSIYITGFAISMLVMAI